MNSTQLKTLGAVFAKPINGNIAWSRIEALLVAVGCRVIEGSGSSVTFEKNGVRAYFHRPIALIHKKKPCATAWMLRVIS